jgi:DNA-binding IclR family transcriptional regulator
MDAVRELDGENTNFTIAQLVETSKLAESTVARSVKVLRDEGMVRMVGKEGMAPVYRWVGG